MIGKSLETNTNTDIEVVSTDKDDGKQERAKRKRKYHNINTVLNDSNLDIRKLFNYSEEDDILFKAQRIEDYIYNQSQLVDDIKKYGSQVQEEIENVDYNSVENDDYEIDDYINNMDNYMENRNIFKYKPKEIVSNLRKNIQKQTLSISQSSSLKDSTENDNTKIFSGKTSNAPTIKRVQSLKRKYKRYITENKDKDKNKNKDKDSYVSEIIKKVIKKPKKALPIHKNDNRNRKRKHKNKRKCSDSNSDSNGGDNNGSDDSNNDKKNSKVNTKNKGKNVAYRSNDDNNSDNSQFQKEEEKDNKKTTKKVYVKNKRKNKINKIGKSGMISNNLDIINAINLGSKFNSNSINKLSPITISKKNYLNEYQNKENLYNILSKNNSSKKNYYDKDNNNKPLLGIFNKGKKSDKLDKINNTLLLSKINNLIFDESLFLSSENDTHNDKNDNNNKELDSYIRKHLNPWTNPNISKSRNNNSLKSDNEFKLISQYFSKYNLDNNKNNNDDDNNNVKVGDNININRDCFNLNSRNSLQSDHEVPYYDLKQDRNNNKNGDNNGDDNDKSSDSILNRANKLKQFIFNKNTPNTNNESKNSDVNISIMESIVKNPTLYKPGVLSDNNNIINNPDYSSINNRNNVNNLVYNNHTDSDSVDEINQNLNDENNSYYNLSHLTRPMELLNNSEEKDWPYNEYEYDNENRFCNNDLDESRYVKHISPQLNDEAFFSLNKSIHNDYTYEDSSYYKDKNNNKDFMKPPPLSIHKYPDPYLSIPPSEYPRYLTNSSLFRPVYVVVEPPPPQQQLIPIPMPVQSSSSILNHHQQREQQLLYQQNIPYQSGYNNPNNYLSSYYQYPISRPIRNNDSNNISNIDGSNNSYRYFKENSNQRNNKKHSYRKSRRPPIEVIVPP